jgi:isoquinoline 1-oxidoreductase beta subunit
MTNATMLSRRVFLGAGGAMVVSFAVGAQSSLKANPAPGFEPNAFISIASDGSVTFTIPRVEMGQGTYTALSMLIAEELEVPLSSVRVAHAPPDAAHYGNPRAGGAQITGGSNSIAGSWEPLRRAGAVARVLLVQAAAAQWGVAPSECLALQGMVVHPASGRKLRYSELTQAAAQLTPPADAAVKLKPTSEFRLIGKPAPRIDATGKVDGSARYGIDMRLPGLRFAAVAASPVFGGKLASVDDKAALAMPGVRQVVQLDNAVAVVADHTWAARQGLAALVISWAEGDGATASSAVMQQDLERSMDAGRAVLAQAQGDVLAAGRNAVREIASTYHAPFLAHAAMEPINCTVDLRADLCEVWVGTQSPVNAQTVAAQASGLPASQVRIHNHLIGGGFGRRLEVEYVGQSVAFARQLQGPVQFIWSREEDIQHDILRPLYADRFVAKLDAKGSVLAINHTVAGSSILARVAPGFFNMDKVDRDAVEAGLGPYAWPASRLDYVRQEPMPGLITGWWRGVGPTHNCFVVEGFMDELASATGTDPLAFRRTLLPADSRARKVLDAVAHQSAWGTPLSPAAVASSRRGRGIALLAAFGSYIAQVAEVTVSAEGDVKVDRVYCAVDCGIVVNPNTVVAQIDGGVQFGITAALWGEITIERGRVVQSNFHNYRLLRINEAARVDVQIVPSTEAPGGVGEPGTSAAIAAVSNAVSSATGRRVQQLPIARG